jgi:hypothetical protein
MASDCWKNFLKRHTMTAQSTMCPCSQNFTVLAAKSSILLIPQPEDLIMIVYSVCKVHIIPSVMLGWKPQQQQLILALLLLECVGWDAVPHACHLAAHNR